MLHLDTLSVVQGSDLIQMVMSLRGSTTGSTLLSNVRSATALSAVLQGERADLFISARPAQRHPSSALATALSGTTLFWTIDKRLHTVEDKKTFPFDVLQNGTICIVVRCVLRNGIKTLQKRYALKTVVERLKTGYGTVVLLLWNNLLTRCVRGCGYMHPWSWQRDRDVSIR